MVIIKTLKQFEMFQNFVHFLAMILMVSLMIDHANSETWVKKVYFTKIETTRNPKYLQRFIINISGNHSRLDVYTDIIHRYPANFVIAVSVTLNPTENDRSHPMLEHHVQFCQFYGNRANQMQGFVKMWIRDFIRYSNLSQDCPQKPGNYSWIGMPVDKFTIPKFFPSAKYEVKVRFYARQNSLNETISQIIIQLGIQ